MLDWTVIGSTTVLPFATNTNTDGGAPLTRAQSREQVKSHRIHTACHSKENSSPKNEIVSIMPSNSNARAWTESSIKFKITGTTNKRWPDQKRRETWRGKTHKTARTYNPTQTIL